MFCFRCRFRRTLQHLPGLPSSTADATARWHVMIVQPGKLTIQPQCTVPMSERMTQWELSIGNVHREFVPGADDVQVLTFPVERAGRHTIAPRRAQNEIARGTRIQELVVSGSAAKSAGDCSCVSRIDRQHEILFCQLGTIPPKHYPSETTQGTDQ